MDTTAVATEADVLNVLHVTQIVGRKAFGLGAAALSLACAQRALGHHVENWSTDTSSELAEVCGGEQDYDRANRCCRFGDVYGFDRLGSGRWTFAPSMYRAMGKPCAAKFQVLHQHAIWSDCSVATRRWRRRYGRPTIISPQGALDAWALRKSRLKKWIAGRLYELDNLHSASCIHAVSAQEASACRSFGLRQPIALIPNGVSRSWLDSSGDGNRFRDEFGISADSRLMLFLSRVTPKKGLPMLFKAIAGIGPAFDDWVLVVAGPDEFGHVSELTSQAADLGITRCVKLVGPLFGQSRRDAFAAADVFVLPTRSEGHPIAVLEALGVGVPVLTTTGAYCDFIPANQCGWQTEINVASLRDGLSAALHCSSSKLMKMGWRGREYVEEHFTWNKIAQQTIALYQWLRERAARPDFVRMD